VLFVAFVVKHLVTANGCAKAFVVKITLARLLDYIGLK